MLGAPLLNIENSNDRDSTTVRDVYFQLSAHDEATYRPLFSGSQETIINFSRQSIRSIATDAMALTLLTYAQKTTHQLFAKINRPRRRLNVLCGHAVSFWEIYAK